MNKLIALFFISLFSLLVNTAFSQAQSAGLFSGYKQENTTSAEKKDSIKFRFANPPQESEESNPENNSNDEFNSDKPLVNSRKIFTSEASQNRIIKGFENQNLQSNPNVPLDSGTPVDIEENSPLFTPTQSSLRGTSGGTSNRASRNSTPYRNQLFKAQSQLSDPQSLGSVDTSVYYSKIPSNYQRTSSTEANNIRKLSNKKPIKYPNFLLFANDVICTTQAGISDGMIFYTPHGSYKLKGNLLTSSNNTYLISGNRIWLDDMIYYFDDSGVYLNNKVYNFKNNVMYRDGVKYQIEGSVVVTEGLQGNHRCIVSELVE